MVFHPEVCREMAFSPTCQKHRVVQAGLASGFLFRPGHIMTLYFGF